VIAEFGHLRNFNALNDAVSNRDLRIREGLAEGETERAQVGVDVVFGAGSKVASQRPVACTHHKRGIHCDQQSRAQDGLRPQVETQASEALLPNSKCQCRFSKNLLGT